MNAGNYQAAEKELRTAISYNPNWYFWHYALGLALHHQNRWDEAIQSLRQTLAINPKHDYSHLHLGYVLTKVNRYAEAEAEFITAVRLGNSAAKDYLIGTVNQVRENSLNSAFQKARTEKNSQKAEALWRKYLLVEPEDSGAWNNIGVALKEQGHYLAAEAAYRKALQLNPNNSLYKNNLNHLMGSVEHGKALEELKAAKEQGRIAKELTMEGMKGRSMVCFDDSRGCTYSKDHSVELTVFAPPNVRSSSPSKPLPAELKKDPEFIKLERNQQRIDQEYRERFDALQELWSKRDRGQGDKAVLDILIVEQRQRLSELKSEQRVNEIQTETIKKKYILD